MIVFDYNAAEKRLLRHIFWFRVKRRIQKVIRYLGLLSVITIIAFLLLRYTDVSAWLRVIFVT